MTPEQKAAFVIAQAACAMAELAAMLATNAAHAGSYKPNGPKEFVELTDRFLIGHNAVIEFFRQ